MSRQVAFDDIIPSELKKKAIGFITDQYTDKQNDDDLPYIKNRHEGYGIMAETFVTVKNAADLIKSGVNDALTALPASDIAFREAIENIYGACVSLTQAAVNMAVHAQNITMQYMARTVDEGGPLLNEIETGQPDGEEIPDFSNSEMEVNEDE